MRRLDKFLISKAPYAVDPLSLRAEENTRLGQPSYWSCRIDAVWFRRRAGVLSAHLGELWDFQSTRPESVREFLEKHDDGRYGGRAFSSWNGLRFWTVADHEESTRHFEVLRSMLDHHPDVPGGYEGWWTFL